jgi:UDP-N-acetylglucosamine/UDP-N-acetylgalactosamine diphosphorylase
MQSKPAGPLARLETTGWTMNERQLRDKLAPFGQEHLLAFWDRLEPVEQQALAKQIEEIDFDEIQQLYESRDKASDVQELVERATSPPAFRLDKSKNRFTPEAAKARGADALAAGQIGAVLVAGGQGTRLGFDHPKGTFPIGPVSESTLFEILVERIRATGRRYGTSIPLYLMTSPATHAETVRYFEENERLGLADDELKIFCQGTMPAVDLESGKALLERPDRLFTSPDGHGGMLPALARSGCLDHAQQRGIAQLFYFQVDNPLADVCGEEFIGYHLLSQSELSTQVIAKQDPLEKVGNVVSVDGRLRVIEYSDLPEELAETRADDGSLLLWAGSIAVHVMDVAFLARMHQESNALPFHIARKKVPHIDAEGEPVEPSEPNAVKFERFIFDLLPAAENAIVMEVDPTRSFAPLKNAPGSDKDTPESVREQMVAEHTRWFTAAGAEVVQGTPVEVSPLVARNEKELAEILEPGTRVEQPLYLAPK